MAAVEVPPLTMILAEVDDGRRRQGRRHALEGMLRLAVIALLSGHRTVGAIAEWGPNYGSGFQETLGFGRHGWPSRSTWYRVLAGIDIVALEAKLAQWTQAVLAQWVSATGATVAIAVDGKTLRGSRRQGAPEAHVLSAVVHELGLTVGQVGVDDKTNELGVVAALLSTLPLNGAVLTTDALLTQKAVARQVIEAGGHYVLPVKDNQVGLRTAIDEHFANGGGQTRTVTVEKSHGRLVRREIETSAALAPHVDWPGIVQVFRLVRTTTTPSGRPTQVVSYGITSMTPAAAPPARLLRLVRGHWTIENCSHWVRDVIFGEDHSQIRQGHAHQVMAALRNIAIALIRRHGCSAIAATIRRFAAQPVQPVRLVLSA